LPAATLPLSVPNPAAGQAQTRQRAECARDGAAAPSCQHSAGVKSQAQEVRDFLCAVSQGRFDAVQDTNVDGLPAETDSAELDPVRYEITRESSTVLEAFC
jgi:hypothetical protein